MTPHLSVPWPAVTHAVWPSATAWTVAGSVLLTIVLAGLAVWRWHRRRQRAYVWAHALIRAPRPVHTTHDEALPRLARERRDRADRYRRAAGRLESGHTAAGPATDRVIALASRRSS